MAEASISEESACTAETFDVEQYHLMKDLERNGVIWPKELIGKYEMCDGDDSVGRFHPCVECPSALTEDGILHARQQAGRKPSFYYFNENNQEKASHLASPPSRLGPAPSQYHVQTLVEEYCYDRDPTTITMNKMGSAVSPEVKDDIWSMCGGAGGDAGPSVSMMSHIGPVCSQYVSQLLNN